MPFAVNTYIFMALALLAAGLLKQLLKKPLQDIRGPRAASWLLGEFISVSCGEQGPRGRN